jgi:hypothetical protein
MGFRFHKRVRLFKGAWINISKWGGSVSIGGRGATTNISRRGVRETVGIPGTGISYQTKRLRIGGRSSTKITQRPITISKAISVVLIIFLILWLLAHFH